MASVITDRLGGTPAPANTDVVTGLGPGVAVKVPCRAVATANISLFELQTIDGVALAEGDRVLCINQTSAVDNGVYIASTGAWVRAKDFADSRDVVKGTRVHITDGTAAARREYFVTTENPVEIDTDALNFDVRAVDESTAAVDYAPVETVASATTTNIGAANSNTVSVTGNNTIEAFDTVAAGVERWVKFTGTPTLTHSANLILPGSANLTVTAGDSAYFKSEGSGVWRCYNYQSGHYEPALTNLSAAVDAKLTGSVATDAEFFSSAAGSKVIATANIETASAFVTLAESSGAIAVDWDTFFNGTSTVDQNTLISNPTNGQVGTWRTILVKGNNTTDRTITFDSHFLGEVPTIIDCDSTNWYALDMQMIATDHFSVTARKVRSS